MTNLETRILYVILQIYNANQHLIKNLNDYIIKR